MMEAVRAATELDETELIRLSEQFISATGTMRGAALVTAQDWGGSVPPIRRGGLVGLLGAAHRIVLVGTLDEVVTGFALGHVEEPSAGGRRGVLDACYVETGARGVGMGKLLIDSTLAWMRDQGCSGVDGIAFPGDRTAKNFFEAAGFKARLLTMHRELG